MAKLILASASPRRLSLLEKIGITPDIVEPANINEDPKKKELPRVYALRMATEKALHINQQYKKEYILSADTVVIYGKNILPKAQDNTEVTSCLNKLSGRTHTVITAICIVTPKGKKLVKTIQTKVKFKRLSQEEINLYIDSKEGIGKAGGYAIQGLAEAFIKNINGSYSNVVGLPLYETRNLLLGAGYELIKKTRHAPHAARNHNKNTNPFAANAAPT